MPIKVKNLPVISLGLSLFAMLISAGSFFISYQQFQFTVKQAEELVSLDCSLSEGSLSAFEAAPEYFIELPVNCVLRNLGPSAVSIEHIQPALFNPNMDQMLNRSIEDTNTYLRNRTFFRSYSKSKITPFHLDARSLKYFDTTVLIPIYFGFQAEYEATYKNLNGCLTNPRNSAGRHIQLSCIEPILGKPLVNLLYEGAEYHQKSSTGIVNGVGVLVSLYNKEMIASEIDIRRLYAWELNPDIPILKQP